MIAVSNLVFQALVLILVVLAQHQGATSTTIGMMLGIYSGGGLIGALAASRLHRHFKPKIPRGTRPLALSSLSYHSLPCAGCARSLRR
ncbi:hypothetical protein [Streptomyces cavernae]|uniref:hypothetical protein n=1 Tax=Streptomyces cavernae TaxID=2259034 RepID=UPI000FEB718E|nr:hypothetical protein [Streptomyces cavernae]